MKDRTYHANIGENEVIILDERSNIGYSYPRILVMFPEPRMIENRFGEKISCEGFNHDVCLGETWMISRKDFNSWLDGTEIEMSEPEKVCKELNINFHGLVKLIETLK